MSMWKTIPTLFGDLADRPDAADVPYGTGWVDEDDNLSISDGTVWTDVAGGGGNPVAVDDDGVEVVADATRLNFGDNLAVTDDGSGEVTIDADCCVECGTDTIPDTETDVSVAHGGTGTPTSVVVTPHEVEPLAVTARDGTTFTVARAGSSGDLDFDWMICGFEDPPPPSEYDAEVLSDNPKAYYLFGDSSGDPVDEVDSPTQDGTVTGTVTYGVQGPIAASAVTAISRATANNSNYIDLPITLGFTTNDGIAFEFFFKNWPAGTIPVRDLTSTGGTFPLFESSSVMRFRVGGTDVITSEASSGYVASSDWHHVVVEYVHSTTTCNMYLDGTLVHSSSISSLSGTTNSAIRVFRSGTSSVASAGSYGRIALYDHPLGATRVSDHWAAAIPLNN